MLRWLEHTFETFLFNSRIIVILAVIGSLASSVLMFGRGVITIFRTAREFFHHFSDPNAADEMSIHLISSVDSFLFATVLLIFAMGVYELFISKLDPASRHADSRPNWLQIHSLDDLKSAIGKVILMILIVQLFESAVRLRYERPLDLLYLGVAVLMVSGALYLQHAAHKAHPPVMYEPTNHHAADDSAPAPKKEPEPFRPPQSTSVQHAPMQASHVPQQQMRPPQQQPHPGQYPQQHPSMPPQQPQQGGYPQHFAPQANPQQQQPQYPPGQPNANTSGPFGRQGY